MAEGVGRVRSLYRYPVKSMAGESLADADLALDGLLGDRAFALRDDAAAEIRGGKRWPKLMQCSARYDGEPTRARLPAAVISIPGGVETRSDDPAASERIGEWLGHAVTLCPRMPASDRRHYRRAQPGASLAGALARAPALRKVVARLAQIGPPGAELRRDFGREAGEPMPDLAAFPAELFEYVSPPGTYFDAFPIHLVTTATLEALRVKQPNADWNEHRFRANFVIESPPGASGFVENAWAGRVFRIGGARFEGTVPTPRCSMVTQAQPGLAKDSAVLRTIVRDANQSVGLYARVLDEGHVAVGEEVELE